MRIVLRALRVVDESGEDNDPEHQEEHEKTQLVRARLERLDEDLESGFEDLQSMRGS